MKSALFAALALFSVPAAAQPVTHELPSWLSGAWEKTDGEKWADEYWTPPRAGIMIGASRSGNGEKLGFWEHMRIMREGDGALAFWAIAGNQPAVRFATTKSGPEEIVFENAQHDYPQRIRYWRNGKTMMAEISLLDGSKASRFSFEPMAGS